MAVSLGGANRKPGVALGLGWDHAKQIRAFALFLALLVAVAFALPAPQPVSATPSVTVPVIVRGTPGSGDAAEQLVERMGGTVGERLEIINGFAAEIPPATILTLTAAPVVVSVTPDTQVRMLDFDNEFATESPDSFEREAYKDDTYYDDDAEDLEFVASAGDSADIAVGWSYTPVSEALSLDPATSSSPTLSSAPPGWMPLINDATGAMDFWAEGFTGAGVDVALIDSGISPVAGINLAGKVVNGLDISFESQADNLRYLDTYGHGTHMAGIIAGRDSLTDPLQALEEGEFVGIAPGRGF